jgi:hypothetical protein
MAHVRAFRHRRHLDPEQIMRNDLHLVLYDRLADVEFLRRSRRDTKQRSGERDRHLVQATHDSLLRGNVDRSVCSENKRDDLSYLFEESGGQGFCC